MILLTGGTGYIGSHMLLLLLESGYDVLVLDNLSNSSIISFERVLELTQANRNKHNNQAVFVQGDIKDEKLLNKIFQENSITTVMHFAGLKAVGESAQQPLRYFDNNVSGSLTLLQAMQTASVKNIVFSSSATVYGEPDTLPMQETDQTKMPASPYGYTKLVVEQMLSQWSATDSSLSVAILRYFNPVGAHASGCIGEDPKGLPNNLMPYISQVAVGKLPELSVFGDDYDTPDGTGVRDYIHVMDLVKGHLSALNFIEQNTGYHIFNLGSGKGHSVLEMVSAFEQATNKKVPYAIKPRRAGDIACYYADPSKANEVLNWHCEYDVVAMVSDTWRWQSDNPNGYE